MVSRIHPRTSYQQSLEAFYKGDEKTCSNHLFSPQKTINAQCYSLYYTLLINSVSYYYMKYKNAHIGLKI